MEGDPDKVVGVFFEIEKLLFPNLNTEHEQGSDRKGRLIKYGIEPFLREVEKGYNADMILYFHGGASRLVVSVDQRDNKKSYRMYMTGNSLPKHKEAWERIK